MTVAVASAPAGTSRVLLLAGLVPAPEGAAAETLTRAGYGAVRRVATIEAALAWLGREQTDVLAVPLELAPEALEGVVRVAQSAGVCVLGVTPALDAGVLLRAMRAGVQECLATPFDAAELAAALERIERRLAGAASAGTAVAVYSAKGGLGTTSVAVNLAYAYAHNNPRARVAIGDLVVSGGDVAMQLDMTPPYDVGTLAGKIASLDAELLRSVLAQRGTRTWVLAASDRPEVTELVDGSASSAIVGQLRGDFEFTVLDCEHHMGDRTLAALDTADSVVLVTQLGLAPLRSAQRSLALFDRLGYPLERVRVVVNRYQGGDVLSLSDAEHALEHPITGVLPNDFRLCADSLAKGRSVVEHDAESALARAFLELAAKFGGAPPPPPKAAPSLLARVLSTVRR